MVWVCVLKAMARTSLNLTLIWKPTGHSSFQHWLLPASPTRLPQGSVHHHGPVLVSIHLYSTTSHCLCFTLNCSSPLVRHPDYHSRVSFTEVLQSLNYDQRALLKVDPRDKTGTPLSPPPGAPLEHGQELHKDLQNTYKWQLELNGENRLLEQNHTHI